MENTIVQLSEIEMLITNGGRITEDTSFGYDVGWILGRIWYKLHNNEHLY